MLKNFRASNTNMSSRPKRIAFSNEINNKGTCTHRTNIIFPFDATQYAQSLTVAILGIWQYCISFSQKNYVEKLIMLGEAVSYHSLLIVRNEILRRKKLRSADFLSHSKRHKLILTKFSHRILSL